MRLYDEGQHPSHDAGEQTIPMEVIPGPIPAALSSPRRPRLPFLQSLYYLVATLVLLGGTLGGLAMYFGWWGLDHLFDGGVQRGLPVQTLITPTPGTPAPTAAWLAQDAFARPDQPLWGRASDGMVWGGRQQQRRLCDPGRRRDHHRGRRVLHCPARPRRGDHRGGGERLPEPLRWRSR